MSKDIWTLREAFERAGSEWITGPRGEMAGLPQDPIRRTIAVKAIDKLLTDQQFKRNELIDEPFISPAPSWQTKFLEKLAKEGGIFPLGELGHGRYKGKDKSALMRTRSLLLETNLEVIKYGYGNTFTLTKDLRNYLDGHLLGDGHYSKVNAGGMCSAFLLHQCIAYSSWIDATKEILGQNGIVAEITLKKPSTSYKNSTPSTLLRTITYRTLKAERLRWYPYGKKIVPSDICLEDPRLLAQWYMGDGSCQTYSHRLLLASHSFTIDENIFLRDRLEKLLGNQVYIIQQRGYASLGIKGKATEVFLEIVRPYLDQCFSFKGKSVWKPLYCVTCGKLIELRLRFSRYCVECSPYVRRRKA